MRRGDLVTIAAPGDYGKPRPAVVVQTNALPESHASVIVCPLTSERADSLDFRVVIEPSTDSGLRVRSHVMADKPVTIRRDRIGKSIGRLTASEMMKLNAALAFTMGLGG
jgi:mRNA interferase MazF